MHPRSMPPSFLSGLLLSLTLPIAAQEGWTVQRPKPTPNDLWAVYFADAQTGWVGGNYGALLKTTDAGTTWTPQQTGFDGNLYFIRFFGKDTGIALGSMRVIDHPPALLRTVDGGAHWSVSPLPPEWALRGSCFLDSRKGWVVGGATNPLNFGRGNALILATEDGGLSWQRQGPEFDTALQAVHFTDAQRGWAVGLDGMILGTADGGATWSRRQAGTKAILRDVRFLNADTGFIVGDDDVFLRTLDGGLTWKEPELPFGSADFSRVRFAGRDTGWALGLDGATNRLLMSTDRGRNWKRMDMGSEGAANALHFVDGKTGFLVGRAGLVWKTTSSLFVSTLTRDTRNELIALEMLDANTGWVAGDGGVLLKTLDGGADWAGHAGPRFDEPQDLEFVDPLHGWILADSGLFRTQDAGLSWARAEGLTPAARYLFRLAFRDSLQGWAVGGTSLSGPGAALRTLDGGATWSPVSIPDSTALLRGIRFVSERIGFILGNDETILRTQDGGETWSLIRKGGSNALFDVGFVNADTGWIVGTSGTMLRTRNGGDTWEKTSLLTSQILQSIHIIDRKNGWIAGWGGALYRMTDGYNWNQAAIPWSGNLEQIQFIGPGRGWAVGSGGLILAYGGGPSALTYRPRSARPGAVRALRSEGRFLFLLPVPGPAAQGAVDLRGRNVILPGGEIR